MQVLMYGWEFPPKNSGGLGVACEGIVAGLMEHGINLKLVLPYAVTSPHPNTEIVNASEKLVKIKISSSLLAYQTPLSYIMERTAKCDEGWMYGNSLFEEVERYRHQAGVLGAEIEHDVIHAHDWMTYPAAIEAKKHSKKPLVVHIHATEIDRTGDNPHPVIYQIEKMGFEHADKIIAVSAFTKSKIVKHYGVSADKIEVVHNAVTKNFRKLQSAQLSKGRKTVLFLGRMTMQKGPEYFLKAAQRVIQHAPDTNFLMAGDGDMMGRMIDYAIDLGIHKNVIFTGFLRGKDIDHAFQTADLFVMPSVSEPFGLVALEAIHNGTPVLMSYQSGVNEVIPNALKVDFWDTDEMANQIIVALEHPEMAQDLIENSTHDLDQISWEKQAHKIKNIYHKVL